MSKFIKCPDCKTRFIKGTHLNPFKADEDDYHSVTCPGCGKMIRLMTLFERMIIKPILDKNI